MRNAVRTDPSLKVILETKQMYSKLMRYDAHDYEEPDPMHDVELDPIPLPDRDKKIYPPRPLFK